LKRFAIFLVILITLLSTVTCKEKEKEELLIFVGAGMKKPMDELKGIYEEKNNVKINIVYGGAGSLLSQIETTRKGDLFMPGSMYHYKIAEEKNLVDEGVEFLYHIPVIVVKRGNPKNIKGLLDLDREGVKIALGDENSLAIGPVSRKILEKACIYEDVKKNVVVREGAVSKLVLDVNSNFVDASIVWRSSAVQFGIDLEIIPIEEKFNEIKTIPIGIVKFTKNEKLSRDFLSFVISEHGKEIFKKYGFVVKDEEN